MKQKSYYPDGDTRVPAGGGPASGIGGLVPAEPGDTRVLVVDDQPPVVRTLAAILSKKNYQVLTATDGQQALKLLEEQIVHVIIADHHMPGMTGTELLQTAARLYPYSVRIMLTGETGVATLLPAVNSGAIDKLLTKPWTPENILSSIRTISRLRRLELENDNLNETLRVRNEELRELNQHLEDRIESKAKALIRAIHYDAVTGLPNRSLLSDRLAQTLIYARRVQQPVAIAMLGIDRLKIINNSLGHNAGNDLLCAFASWLRAHIPEHDVVARLEGDEFALIINGAGTLERVRQLTVDLNERMHNPFLIGDREIYMTVSLGISMFPEDASNVDELFQAAGWALQSARESGGDCCKFFADQAHDTSRSRLSLETELRAALKNEEFILYYQPRVKTENGQILGAEALARWQHPRQGIVMPGGFIALMEQTGLINSLGDWVLMEACKALRHWQQSGHYRLRLSVNISAVQIATGNLFKGIEQALAEHPISLDQGQLELEITESTLMHNDRKALEVLHRIHDLGVRIAIDDFGTGYSALSYLTRFPIDVLKIDRSFVAQITPRESRGQESKGDNALVQAIMNIAGGLRMDTVAEGIETRGQWEFLRTCGCSELQGFFFSKPVPEDEFSGLLAHNQCLPARHRRVLPLLG